MRVGVALRRRLAAPLSDEPRESVRTTIPPARDADLGALVEALTLYARQGLPVWEWRDRGSVADALARLLAVLFQPPEALGVGGLLTLDRDPGDELGVALLAALGRLQIDREEPVTARELAALAGVPTLSVRRLVAEGQLRSADDGDPDAVDARAARAWLHRRGVPGFE